MALRPGNLLIDLNANSFISLTEATGFLADENYDGAGTPAGAWLELDPPEQEGSLVRASRWMAETLRWTRRRLTPDELTRVGRVALRLAIATPQMDLYLSEKPSKAIKKAKAGSVEVEFRDITLTAQAAGELWPWLYPALDGLVEPTRRSSLGIGAYVV